MKSNLSSIKKPIKTPATNKKTGRISDIVPPIVEIKLSIKFAGNVIILF